MGVSENEPIPRSPFCSVSQTENSQSLWSGRGFANKTEKNKNSAHGVFFATLADIALGKTQRWSEIPPIPLVTTSLKIDYLGAAQLGEWIEATANFLALAATLRSSTATSVENAAWYAQTACMGQSILANTLYMTTELGARAVTASMKTNCECFRYRDLGQTHVQI